MTKTHYWLSSAMVIEVKIKVQFLSLNFMYVLSLSCSETLQTPSKVEKYFQSLQSLF